MTKTQTKTEATNKNIAKPKPVYDFFKRCFDFFCSVLALIILSPLFLFISVIIKIDSKGPVIFKHARVGKNGKEIGIYKFRSMYTNADELKKNFTPEQEAEFAKNFKLENDPRVTKVGNILRKTSLDELPQLLNVIKGDLSLVGPRPVLEVETQLYGRYRDLLLSVKPGITGFWAANGRSDTSYKKRKAMEIYYVKNRCFWLDIKILFMTVISVFNRRGAR